MQNKYVKIDPNYTQTQYSIAVQDTATGDQYMEKMSEIIADHKSTTAQATAGIDDTTIITPLKLQEKLNDSLANLSGESAVLGNGNTPAIPAANIANWKTNTVYLFNADGTLTTPLTLADGTVLTNVEKGSSLKLVKTGPSSYGYVLNDAIDTAITPLITTPTALTGTLTAAQETALPQGLSKNVTTGEVWQKTTDGIVTKLEDLKSVCVLSPATNIVANGNYVFNHNLNDTNPIIQGFDGAGVALINQPNIAFTVVDANNVRVNIGSIPLTGFKMKVCGGAMVTYTPTSTTTTTNTLTVAGATLKSTVNGVDSNVVPYIPYNVKEVLTNTIPNTTFAVPSGFDGNYSGHLHYISLNVPALDTALTLSPLPNPTTTCFAAPAGYKWVARITGTLNVYKSWTGTPAQPVPFGIYTYIKVGTSAGRTETRLNVPIQQRMAGAEASYGDTFDINQSSTTTAKFYVEIYVDDNTNQATFDAWINSINIENISYKVMYELVKI
jgi:hypothetical protein